MKNLVKYLFLIGIILSSISCNNDEEDNKKTDIGLPIRFSVGEMSRATQEGTFDKDDAIGIFAYSPRTESVYAVNKKYVFDGKIFTAATAEDEIWITASADVDFYAYYPYIPGQSNINSIIYTIKDQSSREGWLDSDFLTATYKDIVTDYTIQLDFSHRFSTIKVNINDNNKNSVVMNNVLTTADFDLMSGKYRVLENKSAINMYQSPQNNGEFLITLPCQTITSDNKVIISDGVDQNVELSTSQTIVTEEGKIHNYVINNQKAITINNWATGGSVTGDGGYFLGSSCTVVATPKAGYEFEGWYENGLKVSSEPSMTFEVLKDRTLETKYINYGDWTINITSDPASLSAFASTSQIKTSATADIYINGIKQTEAKTATPSVNIKTPVPGFSYDDDTKILSATLNTTEAPRSVILIAKIGEQTKELTVTQNGEKFEYSDWEITITATPTRIKADGSQKSTITATAVRDVLLEGKIVEENVPDDNLQLSGTANGFTFNPSTKVISATNNTSTAERSIVITATTSQNPKSKSVTVTQEKGIMTNGEWSSWLTESLVVTANPTDIDYSGGTSTINVIAKQTRERDIIWNGIKTDTETENQNKDVTSSATYTNNGLNGFTHNNNNIVSAGNNEGGEDRSITVTASYDDKTGNVTISQSGGVVTYGEWNIDFEMSNTTIPAIGGQSTTTKLTASRTKFVNGVNKGTVTGTPTLSGSASGFSLEGTTVKADENMVESPRSITVTATIGEGSEKRTKTVSITQEPALIETTWTIDISASQTTIAPSGGSSTITATATGTKTINGGHAESVYDTPSLSHRGSLSWNSINNTLSAGNNTSTSTKSSTITATIGDATEEVTVTQSAGSKEEIFSHTEYGSLSVTLNSYSDMSYSGGSRQASANISYTDYYDVYWNGIKEDTTTKEGTSDVTSLASWSGTNCSVSSNGSVDVSENPDYSSRIITVSASYEGSSDNVSFTQEGKPSVTEFKNYVITVDPSSLSFDVEGGTKSFKVECKRDVYVNGSFVRTEDADYSASASGEGLSCTNTSATYTENNSTSRRRGTITLTADGDPTKKASVECDQDRWYNVEN